MAEAENEIAWIETESFLETVKVRRRHISRIEGFSDRIKVDNRTFNADIAIQDFDLEIVPSIFPQPITFKIILLNISNEHKSPEKFDKFEFGSTSSKKPSGQPPTKNETFGGFTSGFMAGEVGSASTPNQPPKRLFQVSFYNESGPFCLQKLI